MPEEEPVTTARFPATLNWSVVIDTAPEAGGVSLPSNHGDRFLGSPYKGGSNGPGATDRW